MTHENIGIRCAHYFSSRDKNANGETMDEQDSMCLSICRGVDDPESPSCHLYTSIYELETFRSYQTSLHRR